MTRKRAIAPIQVTMILLKVDLYLAVLFVVRPCNLCCVYEYMFSDWNRCGYLNHSVRLAIITKMNLRLAYLSLYSAIPLVSLKRHSDTSHGGIWSFVFYAHIKTQQR